MSQWECSKSSVEW